MYQVKNAGANPGFASDVSQHRQNGPGFGLTALLFKYNAGGSLDPQAQCIPGSTQNTRLVNRLQRPQRDLDGLRLAFYCDAQRADGLPTLTTSVLSLEPEPEGTATTMGWARPSLTTDALPFQTLGETTA